MSAVLSRTGDRARSPESSSTSFSSSEKNEGKRHHHEATAPAAHSKYPHIEEEEDIASSRHPTGGNNTPRYHHPNQPSTSEAAATGLPRIAVTDPLHEMRMQDYNRPYGLGEKSDYPSRDRLQHKFAAVNAEITAERESKGRKTNTPPGSARPGLSRQSSMTSVSSQSEFGYDDFDWSDDEGVEEHLKQERAEEMAARKKRSRRLSPYKILRWFFVSFLGNVLISAAIVSPAIVMQFVYRNEDPADQVHRDYVTDNVQAWTIWAAFNLFMSWAFHIGVEIFPRIALTLVALIWGRTNQRALTLAEYYSAQKGYFKPILYAACSWASFAIIFNSIYNLYNHSNAETESRAPYLYRIYEVVEFFFFFVLTICVEKILIKNIALNFHKSAFAERLADVNKALMTFDRLKDYRPKWKESVSGSRSPFMRGRFMAGMTPTNENGPSGRSSRSRSPETGFFSRKQPPTRPQDPEADISDTTGGAATYPPDAAGAAHDRRPGLRSKASGATMNFAKSFKTSASAASRLARNAMKDPLSVLQSDEAGAIANINSPAEAKRLAKSIFNAFRGRHRRPYLVLSDFQAAYATVAEAKEAFSVFDNDGNGDISQSEIKNAILETYKERRFLMKAISDTNHAVGQLDLIFLILAFVLIMFEAFAIFNVDVSKTLTTFYTLGIAFAFIFKESAQNVFDSIIFIFVTHAMDTGDRIMLGDAVMVVTKMSLLSSEFTLADGTDMYVANSVLAAMMIVNLRRSGYQWENFTIQVDMKTTLEQLDAVEQDLCHWLATEPERLFEPSTALVPQSINYMRYIEISVGMTHRANWQDWGARFYRKNAFGAALHYYLKKHNIRYYQPNQPIVYWPEQVETAASSPPPQYDGSTDTDVYDLDSFDIIPAGQQAGTTSLSVPGEHTGSGVPVKKATYYGFTPPSDEQDEDSRLRQRRTRNKGLTQQGGDG